MNSLKSLSRFSFIISLTLIFAIALAWIAFDRQVSSQSLPPQTAARPDAAGGPALDFDLLRRLPAGERELPASRYQAARALACRRVSGPLLEKQSGAAEWTNLGPERSAVDPCSQAKEDNFQRPFDVSAGATQFRAGAVYPNGLTILAGSGQGVWRGERGYWKEILAGPSGFVAINRDDRQIIYAAQEGLALKKSDDGGRNFFDAARGIDDDGLFVAPFAMDPNDPQRLWTGGRGLWRTSDGANQWTRASAAIPGSKDARVSAIAIAPHDFNLVLAGTSEGRILRSNAALRADSTTDWSSVQPRRGFVSSIAFDPIVENRIYSTYSTFGGAHVWRSDDGGASWTALDGDSLPDLPVHALAIDPRNPARLFIGTDLGVFISMDGGSSWIGARGGFGAAAVESLTVHQASDEAWLYAFTRGHGVWRLALHQTTQTEPAQTCTYAIAPDAMSFGPAATTGFVVRVTATGTNCSWSASSDAPWATFTTTFPVVGTGEARFNVAANATAQSRAGKLVIAGRDFRIAQAGTGGNCGATPITPGVAIDGALAAGDCPTSRRTVNGLYYADRYSFNGLQGDRIAIVMSSTAFEPDLLLLGPTGALVSEMPGDPANRSLARIPRGGGFFALPAAGAYTIEATSDFAERTGAYRIGLDLVAEQCGTFALSQTIQSFEATGGQGGVQVIGAPGCPWTARINSPDVGWVTIMSGPGGVGSANALFSVAPNTGTAARRADLTIGGRIFTVEQGGIGGACGTRPIVAGATIASSLTSADCGGRERFSFNATPGQAIAVRAASFTPNFFPVITLLNANGTSLATAGGLLPSTGGVFNIPAGGPYTIEIGTSGGLVFGDYAITLFSPPSGCGYTVLPATTTFSQAAAQSGIAITTNGTCPWLAVSDANWITINSASTGTGNGEVKFSVAENTTDLSRRGSVTISGRIVTIDQAGRFGGCATGTITPGQTVSGTIAQADCLSYFVAGTGANTRYADRFKFSGKAGDRVSALEISRQSNPAVTLADSSGIVLAQSTGGFAVTTLPADGDYTIEIANVASATASFAYAVTLSSIPPGCSYSISPFQQRFDATGGEGAFNLTATGGCAWRATSGAAWVAVDQPATGSGDGTIKFKVAANPDTSTRRTVINTGDRNFVIDQAGTSGRCLPLPIETNRLVNGSLNAGDCLSQFVPTTGLVNVSDRYSFDAQAGEQIAVTAVTAPVAGSTVNLPILVNGPSGAIVLSSNNRAPASGFYTIPAAGTYVVEIISPLTLTPTSFLPYTVEATRIGIGCSITLSASSAFFEAAGGTGKFNVQTAAGCEWTARVFPTDAASWLTIAPANGSGAGAVDLSAAANTTATFRRASIVVGDKTFLVDQAGAGASCGLKPIVAGQTVAGSLTAAQCRNSSNSPIDRYSFAAQAGEQIALRFTSSSFVTIVLRDETGATVSSDISFAPFRLPSEGYIRLPRAGAYSIEVGGNIGVSYTMALEQTPGGCTFTLDQTSLTFLGAASSAPLKVVTFSNCLWYAESRTSWIKLDKSSGQGSGQVIVSVEANTTQQSRSGSIYVAGRAISVFQNAPAPPCTPAPIALGQTINGSLDSNDCVSIRSTPNNAIRADRYTLNFSEGQQFTIVGTSANFDPYFVVTDANGLVIAQGSKRLPAGNAFLTLPAAGAYTIEASSSSSFSSGAYSIQLAQPTACAFSLLPASQTFEAAGGAGSVKLVTGAACAWTAASNAAWLTITSAAAGLGNGEIAFRAEPNTSNSLRSGVLRIGDQQFAVSQAGATGSCVIAPIALDQLVTGSLTRGDCPPVTQNSFDQTLYADSYSFAGEAGARVTISFSFSPSSGRVAMLGPNGLPLFTEISANNTVTLPASGKYTVEISSRNVTDYTLRLRPAAPSAANCVTAFLPQSFPIFESAGGTGSIAVSSLDNCAFTAVSNASWLSVVIEPGKINFSVSENTGEYRAASITIAGQSGVTIRQVGKGGSCLPAPIAPGQEAAGALNRFDCQTNGGSYLDRYTFDGKTGDQIALQLLQGSGITVSLFGPSGNSLLSTSQPRQPQSGFFRLPATGAYTIELTGFNSSGTDYRLLLSSVAGACAYDLSAASQAFDQAGGAGGVAVKAGADCPWLIVNPASWITLGEGAAGKGDGTLTFTVAPTSSIFARRATLLIGGRPFVVEQAGLGGACLPRPIEPGKTITGTLDESDCFTSAPSSGALLIYETFTFAGKTGDQAQVQLDGVSQPDIALFTPNGSQVSTTTQTTGAARFTLPADGVYRLRVGARGASQSFTNYQLTIWLNQASCSFTVTPARRAFEAAGGDMAVTLTAGEGCNWAVTNPANWIAVKPGLTGSGASTLTLTIAENKDATYRSATLTIAGVAVFIEQAGAGSSCNPVALVPNQTVNGAISRADCQSQRFITSFADRYTFTAKKGDQFAALLSTFLSIALYAPDGRIVGSSAPFSSSTYSRLPIDTDYLTLPADGVYTLELADFGPEDYALSTLLLPANCSYTLSATKRGFEAAGGTGAVQVLSVSGCPWISLVRAIPSSIAPGALPNWVTITAGASGAGTGEVRYTVASNTTANYRSATLTIAGRNFIVEQAGTSGSCAASALTPGQTVAGAWAAGDCQSSVTPLNYSYADVYTFTGAAGARVAVTLATQASSLALTLLAPNGSVLRVETSPRLPAGGGYLVLPASGTYQLQVASLFLTGAYTLALNVQPICSYTVTPSTLIVDAAGGRAAVTVATSNGCDWLAAASATAPWASFAAADGLGSGTGFAQFTVEKNPGAAPRTGTIRVANANITVTQAGPNVSVSSASLRSDELARGSLASAFGVGLATTTQVAAQPAVTVGGTTVKVRDSARVVRDALIFFVSPGQVNYQLPPLTALGKATVLISASNGVVTTGDVEIVAVAPGLFSITADGRGLAAGVALRVRADGTRTFEPIFRLEGSTFVPVPIDLGPETDEVFLIAFGTGIANRSALTAVTAKIGGPNGVDAMVQFAGPQGGTPGFDQVNLKLPRSLAGKGEVEVLVTADNKMSNPVKLSIR